ncbi:MAG: MATE family efflux transporter [Hungatella sp.]|nr:MATE family efflux transporter [Hungatella sp.]
MVRIFSQILSFAITYGRYKRKELFDLEDNEKVLLFEKMPIPRAIAKLAIPTILSSLVMVIYNLADTYFVGMINDPIQNAAVTLAYPVLLAFNAVNNLFGVGTSSMMSRALGRKDYETVKRSSAFGFYCSLICGILFSMMCTVFKDPLLTVLGADDITRAATDSYMLWTVTCGAAPSILNVVMAYIVRSEGDSLHASMGTMSGCFLNMILDPIFILPWGFNMGAAGAGLATFLSNCFACGYFFVLMYVKRKNTFISIHPRKFGFQRFVVMGICAVGVPASIQNLLNVTGTTILNNFTSVYGADAVAAMGIAQKINMVPFQIALGFSQGVMPLISYNYASGNHRRMKDTILFAIRLMLPAMAAVSAGYYIGAGGLIRLFMDHDEIIAYGTRFLRAFCLAQPLIYMDFLAVGVFQALGLGRNALMFAIMRKIILEIPALFILNALFPLYGLAYAQPLAELVLAAAAVVMLRRIFKKNQGGTAGRPSLPTED